MDERLRNYYLDAQVRNATPGQMLIMLYDCLIQQAELADSEMTSPEKPGDVSTAAQSVSRCINIMTELNASLKYEENATLCGTLSDLYQFFTKELSEALAKYDPKKIRAIIPLIRELRSAWAAADKRAGQIQFAAA
jgi:flagellar secretion chaperone FliS